MGRLVLCACLVPAVAVADPRPITGGGDAPAGAWPDVAALRDGQMKLLCTGTLVAPAVVLTAGHCDRTDLADVLLGGVPLDHPERGEAIAIVAKLEYPSSQETEDATALVLARPSTFAPRAIASGWDLANGVAVTLAGYGATDANATVFVPALQQATTIVTDAACATSAGCNALAQPAGELGAGGMGIDTCVGDSGGPLYVGAALAGVTSRGYSGESALCGMGSIYARADRLVGWLEAVTGATIAHGTAPTADAIATTRGITAMTMIAANDPRTTEHAFAIATPPAHGTARVRSDGTLSVCGDAAGDDRVTVAVTDAHDALRTVAIDIPIHVAEDAAAAPCPLGGDDGGCCDSGRSATGSLPLAVVALLALTRRRRC